MDKEQQFGNSITEKEFSLSLIMLGWIPTTRDLSTFRKGKAAIAIFIYKELITYHIVRSNFSIKSANFTSYEEAFLFIEKQND